MSWNLLQAIFVLFPDWLPIPQLYSHFPEWHGPDQRHLSGGPFQVDYKVTLQPCHGWMGQVILTKVRLQWKFSNTGLFYIWTSKWLLLIAVAGQNMLFHCFSTFLPNFYKKKGKLRQKDAKTATHKPWFTAKWENYKKSFQQF